MTACSSFAMALTVSGIVQELQVTGMRIELGDDFALYRSYRQRCADRHGAFPLFDATTTFIDASNGFWICGFDAEDTPIHTQAVRLLDLGRQTLGEHLDTHRHKFIVPDSTPDPDRTYFRGPEALRQVTGRVAYCGDFWLAQRGLGGPRSHGATNILSRLLFEVLQQAFRPDYAFAFVPRRLAAKGAHLRYGYTHCEPGRWIGPDQQVTEEEYLIWMGADDISNVLEREVPSLSAVARPPSQSAPLLTIDAKGL